MTTSKVWNGTSFIYPDANNALRLGGVAPASYASLSHQHVRAAITDFAHKSTHAIGGVDPLTPADIGALSVSGGTLTGILTAPRFVSNVAEGTAPMTVISSTVVTNFNADTVDGFHASAANSANTIPVRNASGNLTATTLTATATSGPPFTVSSATTVANLSADMLDGYHSNDFMRNDGSTVYVTGLLNFDGGANFSKGGVPFTVASQVLVPNLNADRVDGFHASTESSANSIVVQDANQDIAVRRATFSVATGSSPFSVSSTTAVTNLNSDLLDGYHASTSATANTAAIRVANGALHVGTPTANTHAANLDYVDNFAIHNHRYDYVQHPGYAATYNMPDYYSISLPYSQSPYPVGFGVVIKPHADNEAGVVLQINGLNSSPAYPILDSTLQPVKAGAMKQNGMYSLRFNGTAFILQGEGGGGKFSKTYTLNGTELDSFSTGSTSCSYELTLNDPDLLGYDVVAGLHYVVIFRNITYETTNMGAMHFGSLMTTWSDYSGVNLNIKTGSGATTRSINFGVFEGYWKPEGVGFLINLTCSNDSFNIGGSATFRPFEITVIVTEK